MSYWIEYVKGGFIRQATESQDEPPSFFGGTVAEIDRMCNPAQCLYLNSALLDLGSAPGPHYVLDSDAQAWVLPGDLTELKLAKQAQWSKIKAGRAGGIGATLATPYGEFDADAESRTNITDSILMLQALNAEEGIAEIDFTLADNSVATLTLVQMTHVGLLLGQQVQQCHATSRVLRAQIESATTIEEVQAINWPN